MTAATSHVDETPAVSGGSSNVAPFLSELIDIHERTDWRQVETISNAEAAAWTARLIEARDALQEGGDS